MRILLVGLSVQRRFVGTHLLSFLRRGGFRNRCADPRRGLSLVRGGDSVTREYVGPHSGVNETRSDVSLPDQSGAGASVSCDSSPRFNRCRFVWAFVAAGRDGSPREHYLARRARGDRNPPPCATSTTACSASTTTAYTRANPTTAPRHTRQKLLSHQPQWLLDSYQDRRSVDRRCSGVAGRQTRPPVRARRSDDAPAPAPAGDLARQSRPDAPPSAEPPAARRARCAPGASSDGPCRPSCGSCGASTCAQSHTIPQPRKIPKVGTTRPNHSISDANPLIRLRPKLRKNLKSASNCASWAQRGVVVRGRPVRAYSFPTA
jgi:hypothetical protein